ncbi:MAG: HlyD family efflux transporter periplasmic adaptor subunit [Pseudomonadota bacterium]
MSDHETTLPKGLLRPLRRAFLAICVVMAGVIVWSVWAPLATTVHTSGHLKAQTPSFDIQHPIGGSIQKVLVAEHDRVRAGQVLLELDTRHDRAQLDEIRVQIQTLAAENRYLSDVLDGNQPATTQVLENPLYARLDAMRRTTDLQIRATESNQGSLRAQIDALENRITTTQARRASMFDRFEDQQSLVQRGTFRGTDAAQLNEAILSLDGELDADGSQLIALNEQVRQSVMSVEQMQVQLQSTLLELFVSNQKALPELRRRVLELQNKVDQSQIRAPANGIVTVLSFDTDQMFAPRGETLLTLTRPVDDYQVAFTVAPAMIDQLRVGMVGQVTVTSLPQRNLPKLHAEITALSPEARRDRDGNVVSYSGTARLNPDDLERVFEALDQGARLSIDMPVSVAFPGRTTTFGAYLIAPFLAFMDKSLQD